MNTTQSSPEDSRTVYVVQDTTRLNLSKATRWGRLTALLPENNRITLSPQPCLRELRQKLKDFDDDDSLLMLGDPVAMGLAFAVASEMNRGRVRCLKWDKELGDYYEITVDFYDKPEKDHAA